jgi:oligopeptidase A
MNPLLQHGGLPLFDQIKPEHVKPAVEVLLQVASEALETVTAPAFPTEWDAIAKVLDVATERLSTAWGAVSHLNSVADSPELRAAYNESLPVVTEFWTRLGADERLYAKYKQVDATTLDAAQKQALQNALRNFVLGGAELVGESKTRYAAIQERMAELSQKFSENALDATEKFSLFVSEDELDGVPEDVKTTARAAAEKDGQAGFKLTLKMPCYLPIMQFATSSALRQKLYQAYVTRASDQSDPAFAALDNSQNIQEILQLRQEEAQLLGYQNYAEVSVATKMAASIRKTPSAHPCSFEAPNTEIPNRSRRPPDAFASTARPTRMIRSHAFRGRIT